jgi:tripartite-type tricarboxylate transporter receptor subunit TctC
MRRIVTGATPAALGVLVAAGVAVSASSAAAQSSFPSKPVRFIVVVAAGGGADFVGRLVAERLTPRLGEAVIVENKTGAGGNIATEYVARSPADGYTLLLTTNSHTMNPLIYKQPGYELKDFVPVIELCEGPSVLVTSTDSPFKTLKDVVDAARAKPGSLSYGSSGIGLPVHIATELFKQAANIDMVHIPFRGAGQSVQAAIGGQVPLVMSSISAAMPHILAHKLRPLAITGATRWPSLPDVPTMIESGYPGVVNTIWLGILAPQGTPPDVVARLNREIAAVLQTPDIAERMSKTGMAPVGKSPEAFAAMLKADQAANEKIAAQIGLKAD